MIRDITIGQYYQGESLIHKLDPRMKVVGVLVYLISLFCFRYVIGFLVAGLFFVLVLCAALTSSIALTELSLIHI